LPFRGPVLVACLLLTAGCGGSKDAGTTGSTTGAAPAPGSLRALLARPGADTALVAGTSDYAAGPVRASFLVIRGDGRAVSRPAARFWVAKSLDARPFTQGTARLEPVGTSRSAPDPADVTSLYVAHFRLPKAGRYWLLAEPIGASPPIQGVVNLDAASKTRAPAVGSKAIASRTPTLASVGGAASLVTTRVPPDLELLRTSIRDALRVHAPFVVTFATPKFCTSRACGPVVDVVDEVRRKFAGGPIKFIHVEIYEDNDPSKGFNRWVREWRLPTEPFTFLVGRDGRIKAKFEGSLSVDELTAAVRRELA
jgi:hypothetical protein